MAEAKRGKKATITYLDEGGNEVKLINGGVSVISYNFEDGRTLEVDLDKIGPSAREIGRVRGIAEKIRDEYAGADDVDEAYEWAVDMRDRLYNDEWMGQREGGGPSISWFIEAVKAVKAEALAAKGQPYDADADEPALRERYVGKDKAKARSGALSGNAALRARYDAMLADAAEKKAARARERAAKSAAVTGAAAVSDAAL